MVLAQPENMLTRVGVCFSIWGPHAPGGHALEGCAELTPTHTQAQAQAHRSTRPFLLPDL